MKIGILGRKLGCSQLFDPETREVVPVTVIKAGPCLVLQKKTKGKDGYDALQIGLIEPDKKKKVNKPLMGHLKASGAGSASFIREIRGEFPSLTVGSHISLENFEGVEKVNVIGTSKGKGFQGVVFRHGFRGGAATHGSMFHRAPGSIGASSYPSRVFKGTRMGGRMGGKRVTVANLKVVKIDTQNSLLLVKGAVPGPRNGLLVVSGQ
ncbi:MAG: 50S ribosomal protein L3 [Acidobacteria bacterium]|nr:50S ribosomal protein L3 [Acidobacteriota bacterium]